MVDPTVASAMITALAAQGTTVTDCAGAFSTVYSDQELATGLDEAARNTTISEVAVAGDIATITYSSEANGERREGLTNKLKRADGTWLLLPYEG